MQLETRTDTATYAPPRLVDQQILHTGVPGERPGDCMRACFASIFDRHTLEVPHFAECGDDWWDVARGFVSRVSLGEYELMWFPYLPNPEVLASAWDLAPGLGVVLCGPSPRGDFNHAVVGDPATMAVVFDPHPSRAGLLSTDVVFGMVAAG